ncbi:MAG: SdrD B-like domain-containing protein [Candidatus Promineifilaceae bacterium]|nr:SdrD B-like domain-containing protein [Candidatus Promineifilaceae bacterium]
MEKLIRKDNHGLLGAAVFLVPIFVLILLSLLLVGSSPFSVSGAPQAVQQGAPNDMLMPIIFGGGSSGSGGFVYRDYDANGSRGSFEPGVPGIIVSAYTNSGYRLDYNITDSQGRYDLALLAGEDYRLEFTGIPDYLQPGVVGNDSEATVAFVTGPTGNVDVGLNNPAQYCQDNPELGTPCYLFGKQTEELPAVVSFHNRAGSTALDDPFLPKNNSPYDDANNDEPGIQVHPIEAFATEVGTSYGLAYQRSNNVLFTSAFMKRHSGFGPGGTGAIYRIDRDTRTVSMYADLNAIFGADTAGANPHDSTHLTDPDEIINFWLHDSSFDEAGKISLGDLEITEDEQYLYVINLADKMLYRIPVLDQASPVLTSADIDRFAMPTPANCAAADTRPFSLAGKEGKKYKGNNGTAQNTQNRADKRAEVYTIDGSGFTGPVLSFRLDYPRLCADRVPGNQDCGTQADNKEAAWNPWISTFGDLITLSGVSEVTTPRRITIYPQPLLSDIEFANGYMILGFRDRNGDLIANGAHDPRDADGNAVGFPPQLSEPTILYMTVAAGDILAAAPDPNLPGRWILENNASVGDLPPTGGANNGNGPGNGEYFYEENFAVDENFPRHSEIAQGALTNIPGQADAITTAFNPIPIEDPANFFDGGIIWLGGEDGTRSRSYRVFAGEAPLDAPDDDISVLLQGKNNGLGDLEVFCEAAPLEIGDRVWVDTNTNGIQDPGEPPLAGVSVGLFAPNGNTLLGTAVTDASGNYYFSSATSGPLSGAHAVYGVSGLQPNTNGYKLRIDMTQSVIAGNNYVLTVANADGHTDNDNKTDLRDSDGSPVGQNAEITFNTQGAGHNNHTLDFGFIVEGTQQMVAVGNRVWLDDGAGGGVAADGIVNGSEMGVGNVMVELYQGTSTSGAPLASTQTLEDGCYLFDNLLPGDYVLHIPASQFSAGAVLEGYETSLPEGGDNGLDDDMDENGQNTMDNGGISSTVINLAVGSEPVDEPSRSLCASTQPDANEDMTVDFGFYMPGPPMPGIEIIKKTNGQDANEPVLPGVPQIPPGATVTWTYEVKNTGNVSFAKADVVVTDSQGVEPVFDMVLVGNDDDFLDPLEVWQYIATGTAGVVGQPMEPGTVPVLWGIDEDDNGLFTIDDYTQIGAGAAAAGYTNLGHLYFIDVDGVTQMIPKDVGSFTIDTDNVAYMAYNRNLDIGGGLPELKAPVLLKIALEDVSANGQDIVTVVGSIPIPGFEIGLVDDNISGLSFDPRSGALYGLYRVTDGPTPDHLLIIDKTNAALLKDVGVMENAQLGAVVEDGEALEFDSAGNLYVSDNWDDQLYSIDPETAQITAIVDNDEKGGLTGITRLKTEGLAWDPVSDTMVASDDNNDLFYIQTLENGNNISLGVLPELTDVEAIDFLIPCYMNIGRVTATVVIDGVVVAETDHDASHYCN